VKKLILAAALLAGASIPLTGCNLAIPGTTAAYANCYRSLKAQNLDDEAARISCINSNSVAVHAGLGGQAHVDSYTQRSLDATVTNTSTDLVITSYKVDVSLQNGKKASKLFNSRFLQPGQSESAVLFPFEMSDFQIADFTAGADNKTTWSWNVTPLAGLTISAY
jgi:hypothetical protein